MGPRSKLNKNHVHLWGRARHLQQSPGDQAGRGQGQWSATDAFREPSAWAAGPRHKAAGTPRVKAANQINEFMAACILELMHRCIAWSIETQLIACCGLSPMWQPSSRCTVSGVLTSNTAPTEGDRPKRTAFVHYPASFLMGLRAVCPGEGPDHQHAPWGQAQLGHLRHRT